MAIIWTKNSEIVSGRMFPKTGTYLGTLIEVAEPEQYISDTDEPLDPEAFDTAVRLNAAHYNWLDAKRVAFSTRFSIVKSDSTVMIEHRRPGSLLLDIYASPSLGIKRHIPVMAQDIAEQTAEKLNHLATPPELRPIWLPLGHQALNKVTSEY